MASGARREWRETQGAAGEKMAWAGRGDRLFFVRSRYVSGGRTVHELFSLPVAGAGRTTTAAGRPIRTVSSPRAIEGVASSADGHRVYVVESSLGGVSASAGGDAGGAEGALEVVEVSAADGGVVRTIRRREIP
ncbi:hypothetical protein GWI34_24410 [Actinomadura sp. DSM 109109]|nr:hypothetical protein [Actinomadura lepetitiana]